MVCAITKTGELRCWGGNRAPSVLGAGSTWKSVSVGWQRFSSSVTLCAIKSDDTLWCWTGGVDATPAQPDTIKFEEISLAQQNRCAIADTGGLYCWGTNNFGALGVADGLG